MGNAINGGNATKYATNPWLAASDDALSAGSRAIGAKNPMDSFGGFMGKAVGPGGTGVDMSQQANVQQGTSVQDVQNAQAGVGNSLASQQNLLQALQGQNGMGQQNAIAGQQQALAGQLGAANGIGTQNNAIQGLQGAAGQYQNIANGTGPNPAMAALHQATGQNVANQAALMAGQRGAGANVGMLARQAAQQGAATQQQAVGQGATMQANQQVNALAGLTNANQAMGNLGTSQLGAQQAQQQAMANQANQVANQQIGATTANAQANLANQQQQQNALAGVNTANVASQGSVNAGNTALGSQAMQGKQGLMGGVMNGIGSLFGAEGGQVPQMAEGGPMGTAPSSSFGQFLSGWSEPGSESAGGMSAAPAPVAPAAAPKDKKDSGIGGLIALMASNGGLATTGGHVAAKAPAQKAVASGNSYSNDKIPAKLSEGEIVLPRSVTMSDDPIRSSADFVRKVLAKRKMK